MPLSTNTYTYNGGPQTFAATFADGYIEREHVTAYRVGDFDGLGEQIYLDFTWNSDAEILVTNSLTAGDEIVVQRTVPKDAQLVDLSSEGGLTRESLERNARQSLHAVHEVLDGRTTDIENIDQLVAQAEAAAQQALDAVATVEAVEWRNAGDVVTSAAAVINARNGIRAVQDGTNPNLVHIELDDASGGTVNLLNDIAALEASTEEYAEGTRVTVQSMGMTYYVPAQPVMDAHVTTAAGVGLYEAGPQFTTAARMRQAVQLGIVPEGAQFGCYGYWYTKDAGAVGLDSAFYDYGIDGVRRPTWLPDNLFLATLFRSQVNERQYFYNSPDALSWKRLNRLPQRANQNDRLIGGRDADLVFYPPTGELIRPVTAGTGQDQYDYSSWRSSDGLTHDLYRHWLGPTQFRPTLPDPNGDGSTQQIWGPKIFHDKESDEYYVLFTARTGDDYVNQLGGTSPTFRPHIARINNLQTLETDAPVMMDIEDANFAALSPDIIRPGGTAGNYFLAIKSSADRNTRIYQSATLLGTWVQVTTLDYDNTFESNEGPVWAPYIYRDSSASVATAGPRAIKYRLIVAHNRDLNDNLLGEQIYFEADTITGTWTGPHRADWPYAVRNGGVKNMALEYSSDPRAMQIVENLIDGLSGDAPDGDEERVRLVTGASTIYPQQDNLYYSYAARDAQVTIGGHIGNRFTIMVSDDPSTTTACGITIAGNEFIDAYTLGYANTSERGKRVTFEWTEPREGTTDFEPKYRPVLDNAGGSGSADGVVDTASFDSGSRQLTLGRTIGADLTVTIPGVAGAGADGVVTSASYNASTKALTLSRSEALGDVTASFSGLPYRFFGATAVLTDAGGNDAWGIRDATVDGDLIPFGGARGIGRDASPIIRVWYEGQSVDGTSDGTNNYAMIVANSGVVKLQEASTTGNNQGQDVASRVSINDLGSWSGTYVWDREDGSYIHATLSAPGTIDLSDMKQGEVVGMTLRGLQNHGVTFVSAAGVTIRWIGTLGAASGVLNPAGTFWTNSEFSVIRIPNAIHIVAAEAQVP